ncbi:uncharacterized protein LOC129577737 [Sitodiplosis mosellana]|uniref:uncharacterized protein LOC129577737 n=1 Tax=Sitodiplosis mosellana TaxID=263140 RepID=UPI002444B725|nr:uncharacterized protein LOC129577737 [Sitodiplosis mosellana]
MSNQCVSLNDIKHLKTFLEKCLNKKVLEYKLNSLTNPGDNFGSILRTIDLNVIENSNSNEKETMQLVVKTSVLDPYWAAVFKPELSFVKEVHFYANIIPAIQQFEQCTNVPEAERLNVFIQCLGSRISLNSNAKEADRDAVLLLENLKHDHFVNVNRYIRFDTQETIVVLKNLAKFHALCIAMRQVEPDLFKEKVNHNLSAVGGLKDDDEILQIICDELHLLDKLSSKQRELIKGYLQLGAQFVKNSSQTVDTPYTTIIHFDLWINNIMVKKGKSNPTQIKIYDFQLYVYESFVHDLIFFLFMSVGPKDLVINFKLFIDFYLLEFIRTMGLVKCSSENYTFEK